MTDPLGCLALGFLVLAAIALLAALGVGVGVVLAMMGRGSWDDVE